MNPFQVIMLWDTNGRITPATSLSAIINPMSVAASLPDGGAQT